MRQSNLVPTRQFFLGPIQVPVASHTPGFRKRLNAKVSGRVYVEHVVSDDSPGRQSGMQSIKIELLNASGASIAQTLTDQDGNYCFDQFAATGSYTIRMSGSTWLTSNCHDQHIELRYSEQVFAEVDFCVKLRGEIKHHLC